eukprot:TRINITY_DN6135_c0_g1_i1.p1 TRINITY_DN6135_c0_g1~~TRINITY_DN6135_c0_g1_i1.p1  ORF type:complete len:135 (-),score=18.33 TRINITY_DN6135_c0_g1_i1:48-452(-)
MGKDSIDVPIFKEGAKNIQMALPNDIDKYKTRLPKVRLWLNEIINLCGEIPPDGFPIMFHCARGKDRTGIVVAVILLVLGFPVDLIEEEFLISSGTRREDIKGALEPIEKNVANYFRKIDLEKFRKNVIGVSNI